MICPTCGRTTTEPHPRLFGGVRCANCKEHLAGPKSARHFIVEPAADPLAHCPYCGDPTPCPLAGCDKPECTRREIEHEAALKRLEDV